MTRPRLGFLGTGWIGRHRMEAMLATRVVEAAAVCDPDDASAREALLLAPQAARVDGLGAMLAMGLDGIVVATPSAHHAAQTIAALDQGAAVFCQKPLGRNADEAQAAIAAARRADRLLAVDFSYRRTRAVEAIGDAIRKGSLGTVFAVDLVFHNAYGPGREWFFDRAQSGGGCVMDLGVHLVDLALFLLEQLEVRQVSARLFAGGQPLARDDVRVEDYAVARIDLDSGAALNLACSWNLNAGADAVISATFYGTEASAGFRNVGGSFYDFEAFVDRGTSREIIASAPDAWGGRVAADWALRLAQDNRFDPAVDGVGTVAHVLDRIYAAA
ncbi:Gfo/Idh/MocA family oxidoreductase [Erythrobacteraceae bacterium CFH 75059]|uniref:Gfo/Idh/MocA family protein n=1 Tax=Qipengyuania thermophila TaxID=2509361 RepID=UPI00101FCAF3|nr:Gfo/Idh/MocA family oxidoreductase [Qipengyuania thermophila]TCD05254.1 Gfo/Idh/MocA family oxidoreductase [Erythrobacteraceae bacterium CFH 75059]